MSDKTKQKLEKLLELLRPKKSLLIVMQDNPDPDAIAAAAALRRIANVAGEVSCSITYGGIIGRSENRALASYLGLNFRPIEEVEIDRYDATALVDTQPQTGNNSLPESVLPDIVLDHHPLRPETRRVPFTDVRSKYGALSTILFEYLSEAGIEPDPPLATALLYGIRTDTQDLGHEAIQADVSALEVLYPLANTRMLSAIQRWKVTPVYFQTISRCLDNARVQGPCLHTCLGHVDNPDLVAEMADLFLRLEGIEWSLACGRYLDKIWVSVRTSQTALRAEDVMKGIMGGLGTGGGHDLLAGGQVLLEKGSQAEQRAVQKDIRDRFLREVEASRFRPKKLLK
jgi:nanoRNase/pAp phosphatase (c-di-AMP/oligoRNAs hydrolase)